MLSVLSCDIRPCSFSDHHFVCLSTQPNSETSQGPGLWKFNFSLLSNKDFSPCITDRLQGLAGSLRHFLSVKLWWDFFKEPINAFAKEKQRRRLHEHVVLTNHIFRLKTVLAAGDLSVGPKIAAVESQLQSLIVGGLKGAKTHSWVQWLEEEERPMRYFFHLEHMRVDRNGVSSILNDQGTEVFASAEIEQAHRSFYSKLFSEEPIDPEHTGSCLRSVAASLSSPQRDSCKGLLTLDELSAAVRSLSVGKSPGSEGLTVPLFLRVANECFRYGELAASMKNSIACLIFKKQGDRKDLKTSSVRSRSRRTNSLYIAARYNLYHVNCTDRKQISKSANLGMWTCSCCLWSTLPFNHVRSDCLDHQATETSMDNLLDCHQNALTANNSHLSIMHLNTQCMTPTFAEFTVLINS